MYKILVPYGKKKIVRYPASGEPFYTRERAVEILKRFYSRCPWQDGDDREPWAEGPGERFTIFYPVDLTQEK